MCQFMKSLFIWAGCVGGLLLISSPTLAADRSVVNQILDDLEFQGSESAPAANNPETAAASVSVAPADAIPAPTPVQAAGESEEPKTLLGDLFKEYDIAPSGSVTLDYYSRYVWRGQYLDRDSVLEPGISISAKGFTFGYWSNFDMENNDSLPSDESDFYASYSYTFDEKYTITGGHTWYDFPEYKTSSKEFFVSIAMAEFLSPTLSFYHDYEDGKDLNTDGSGNYYSLGLSHTFTLDKQYNIALALGATLGYVDGQWLSGTGWHFTPTAGLVIPLTKSFTITPNIGYNVPMGDLKDPAIGNQEKKVFGGVRSTVTF